MSERLTLQDLIDLLAKKQGITKKDAEVFLRELITLISETIEQNEQVKIKDFGTFKLTKVSARKSVDVNTGEAIEIAAHYKLSFTPDKSLREAINRPFAHFESVILEEGVSFDNIESRTEELVADDTDVEAEDIDTSGDKAPSVEDTDMDVSSFAVETESEVVEVPIEDAASINVVDEQPVTLTEEQITEIEKEEAPEVDPVSEEDNGKVMPIDATPEVVEEKIESDAYKAVSNNDIEEPSSIPPSVNEDITDQDLPFLYPDEEKRGLLERIPRWVAIVSLLLVLALAAGFIFRGNIASYLSDLKEDSAMSKDQQNAYRDMVQNEELSVADTLKNDSLDIVATDVTKVVVEPVKEQPVQSVNTQPLKTVKIEPGMTMRMIGLDNYGNKSFWVYIYQENKDKIKNPNNVPLGTVLTLPSREKYGIDPKSPESVKKARQMEEEIFKQFE